MRTCKSNKTAPETNKWEFYKINFVSNYSVCIWTDKVKKLEH